MKLCVISDHHNNTNQYDKVIKAIDTIYSENAISYCLGDEASGFIHNGKKISMPILNKRHKFITGNHSDRTFAKNHPNYAGDYGIDIVHGRKIFYISGEENPDFDSKHRKVGIDYFPESEQLSYEELIAAKELYLKEKPDIVLAHTCPQNIQERLYGYKQVSRTRFYLELMWQEYHCPIFIYGHFHANSDFMWKDTRFICKPELGITTINLETLEVS